MPAQQAFLPRTLEVERLPSANAMLQGTYQLASIVGPPIAGAVIAVSSTGVAFAVDATRSFVAAIVIAMIGRPGAGRPGRDGHGRRRPRRPRTRRRPRRTSRSWPRSAAGSGMSWPIARWR